MKTSTRKQKKSSYYLLIGIIGIIAVVIGFLTTYIKPSLQGTFKAPIIVHVHGAFAFAWIILFLIQSILVKNRNIRLHKTLGYGAMFIAFGIVATMIPVGLFQVKRDLSLGMGETAISQIIGVITTAVMFAVLIWLGYRFRKKPPVHKRLLLLATILLLWPAWFRFRHYFPSVPRLDIWFAVVLADSLILLSWLVDKKTYNKIHPVLLYGGLFIIAEHVFEVLMFDSGPWRMVAKAIYNFIA